MNKGMITNSIVPLRHSPDDRSEMETQLLFGETFRILEKRNQWRKIRNDFDGYEGWIDEKAFETIPEETYDKLTSATAFYVADVISILTLPDGTRQHLPAGSLLPFFNPGKKTIIINGKKFLFEGQAVTGNRDDGFFFELIEKYRNAPYLWGGTTPFGIDCSGLTQMVYKISGRYRLPRNASQQAKEGKRIDFERRKPGDLAFFVNEKGNIHHVGIVWFDGKIIHAHGKVRLDELHPSGIYNYESGRFTHDLVLIKRLV
jgi:hypothetical protein